MSNELTLEADPLNWNRGTDSMRKPIALLAGILLGAAAASAGVSIKLTGGMGYTLQGDYARSLRGAYDAILAGYSDVEGGYQPFGMSLRTGFEILIPVGRSLELGLGVGYERLSADNRFRYRWTFVAMEDSIQSRLSVVPITLTAHSSVRLGRRLGLDIFGGLGYYSVRFRHDQETATDFFGHRGSHAFESRTGTPGFHGGAALEYDLGPGLCLVLQADGRFARISELKGELIDATSWFLGETSARVPDASFWMYEAAVGTETFPFGTFAAGKPADPGMNNVRPAGLDLGGFGISAGLKLRL